MMAQLPRMVAWNVTVALVSFLTLFFEASPRAIANDGTAESDPKLGTVTVISIQVQTPDDKPLSNVTVVCVGPSAKATLNGTSIEGGSERMQTDTEGRFRLPLNGINIVLMVANDRGFSLAQSCDLIKSPTMIVHPWGRIQGCWINRDQPVVGQRLKYDLQKKFLVLKELEGTISVADRRVVTDSEGRFAFEFVPPVDIILFGMQKHPEIAYTTLQLAEVKPGKTNRVEIATHGRTIVGNLELAPGLTNRIDLISFDGGLHPDMDKKTKDATLVLPSIPKQFDTPERKAKWWRNWYQTDAGRQRMELFSRLYGVEIHSDGSFVADLIEPGKYLMTGNIEENGKTVAVLSEHIEIPQVRKNAEHEPFDIGKVIIKATVSLEVGDVVPDFSVMTLAGNPLKLSALRGKYVLLDFWATWCGPCVVETPNLKAAYDAFGKDDRFVLISLSLDSDQAAPKKFARTQGIAWTQGFLGDWSKDKVTQSYGVYGIPAIFLIGPDGKVLATDLRGPKIKEAVAAVLAH